MRCSSEINKCVGRIVRAKRLALGHSQEELADICGLHRTYIGGIERGERNITLDTLDTIASGLKCSITDFFQEK